MADRSLAASPPPAPAPFNPNPNTKNVIYVDGTKSPTIGSETIYVRGSNSPDDNSITASPSPPPKRKRTPTSPLFIPSTYSPPPVDVPNNSLFCTESITATSAADDTSMIPTNTLMDIRCSVALIKEQKFTASLRTLQLPQSLPPAYYASSDFFLPPHTPSPLKFTGGTPSKSPHLFILNDIANTPPLLFPSCLNLCVECGVNMGPNNGRQLCGKTKCDNYFMNSPSPPPPYSPKKKVRFSE